MADSDVLANEIYPALTADVDFTITPIDLTDPKFQIPETVDNPLYDEQEKLTEAQLTERKSGGNGMFDGLMESVKQHLLEEYKANRLSGKEYTNAYVSLTQTAMGNAVQYLLSKDTSYWQAVAAQQQARITEMQLVQSKIGLEIEKLNYKATEADANTKAVNYANAKQNLAITEANYDLLVAQKATADYELTNILPQQLLKLTADTSLVGAQEAGIAAETSLTGTREADVVKDTALKDFQLVSLLPKELEKATAEISMMAKQEDQIDQQILRSIEEVRVVQNEAEIGDYRITNMLPIELAKMTADKDVVLAEELRIAAQTAQISTETATLLPKQVDKLTADISLTGKQEDQIDQQILKSAAEVRLMDAEADIAEYRVTNMLPIELVKLTAEKDVLLAEELRVDAQVAQINYETTSIMPEQLNKLQKESAQVDYQTTSVLPKEVLRLQNQIDVGTAEISRVNAQEAQITYETASILPSQKANIDADKDIKVYQLSDVLPSQVAKTDEETLGLNYTRLSIMPSQKDSIDEQVEAHRAKTLDTRRDGTAIAGAIGKQKDLHQEQITSYKRDAETKAVKLMTDMAITSISVLDGGTVPDSMNNPSINSAFGTLKTNLGL